MIRSAIPRCLLLAGVALLLSAPAWAAEPKEGAATSAGPGRILCSAPTQCELGLGTPARLKYSINAAGLPDADKARLKTCTAKDKTPCVVTVEGTEMGDPMKIKAKSIKWYN